MALPLHLDLSTLAARGMSGLVGYR